MKKTVKRGISLMIALLMCASLCTTVWADLDYTNKEKIPEENSQTETSKVIEHTHELSLVEGTETVEKHYSCATCNKQFVYDYDLGSFIEVLDYELELHEQLQRKIGFINANLVDDNMIYNYHIEADADDEVFLCPTPDCACPQELVYKWMKLLPDENIYEIISAEENETATTQSLSVLVSINDLGVENQFVCFVRNEEQYGVAKFNITFPSIAMAPSSSKIISSEEIEKAISYAYNIMNSDPSGFKGYCAAFVWQCYRYGAGLNNKSAATARQLGDVLISNTDSNPPRGALVFWYKSSAPYTAAGHVGLSLGNGKVIHAFSDIKISSISGVNNSGYTYRGWGAPIQGYILEGTELSISEFNGPEGNFDTLSKYGLRGVIASNHPIEYIEANILDANGNIAYGTDNQRFEYSISPNVYSYNIANDGLNNAFKFGALPNGEYSYNLFAKDSSGKEIRRTTNFVIGPENKQPVGFLDSAIGESGTVTVTGWAFDNDDLSKSLEIHIYVGGPAGTGASRYIVTANKYRPDVNEVYPGAGNYHGFKESIEVNETGTLPIYAYAINVPYGKNPELPNSPNYADILPSNILATGTCGDNLTWTLDNSYVLTIKGAGNMYDFSHYMEGNPAPWREFNEDIEKVVICNGVSRIGDFAFDGCYSKTIEIPSSVTTIGANAFQCCFNLENISIPSGVTTIGDYAFVFSGCTSVSLPATLSKLGTMAFARCSDLQSITVADDNPYYYSTGKTLYNKDKTELVLCVPTIVGQFDIPSGVEKIRLFSFSDSNITSVFIPSSVNKIEEYAFSRCDSLTDIYYDGTEAQWNTLKNSIDSGNDPLLNETVHFSEHTHTFAEEWSHDDTHHWHAATCEHSNEITDKAEHSWDAGAITTEATYLGDGIKTYACTVCGREKEEIIPYTGPIITGGTCGDKLIWTLDNQGVLTISGLGNMANYSGVRTPWYSYNSQIKTVVIGSGVTSIGRNAFQTLTGLTSVSISSSVTVIGEYAFDNCYKLTEISLPSSVGTIERCAFYSTTYVSVDQSNSYFKSTDGVLYAKDGKTLYHVPDNYTNFIIPEQVETIFDGAFKDCVKLETLTLPSGLKSIGHMAFYNCSNLVSLTMSSNVTSIGMSAFWDCGKLTDVYYDGTEEQWKGFTSKAIAAKNNGQIQKVTVHYVSTPQGLPEFSVSHPATVNITAPENGWVIGDNTFSVSAERPCVLAVSYDGGQTYTRLTASANGDGSYSFDVNITDDNTILVCSFFGDSNGDGDLSSGDVSRLNAGILHKVTLSALSKLVCDVNNDSDLSSGDVSRLNAVILNKVKLSW